jgi:hypothetical protein
MVRIFFGIVSASKVVQFGQDLVVHFRQDYAGRKQRKKYSIENNRTLFDKTKV